jgi:hypothetical protein
MTAAATIAIFIRQAAYDVAAYLAPRGAPALHLVAGCGYTKYPLPVTILPLATEAVKLEVELIEQFEKKNTERGFACATPQ